MSTTQITTPVKNSILAFVKNIVSKRIYKEINLLLSPCCKPVVDFGTYSCASVVNMNGVLFTGVKISDPALANKSCKVFITAPEAPTSGVLNHITLDSKGYWTGNLQSSIEGAGLPSPIVYSAVLTLIPDGYNVAHQSDVQVLSLPNCD
jgi:hypothetical protein